MAQGEPSRVSATQRPRDPIAVRSRDERHSWRAIPQAPCLPLSRRLRGFWGRSARVPRSGRACGASRRVVVVELGVHRPDADAAEHHPGSCVLVLAAAHRCHGATAALADVRVLQRTRAPSPTSLGLVLLAPMACTQPVSKAAEASSNRCPPGKVAGDEWNSGDACNTCRCQDDGTQLCTRRSCRTQSESPLD